MDARAAFRAMLITGSLVLLACGAGPPSASDPSPAAVDTAEAIARNVTIDAAFSTTPAPGDDERETPIVLDGRIFGDGDTGVILAHMRPTDQTSWFPFATRLAETGDFTVLTFNFRGFEPSTGDKEFDRIDTDLHAAYDYMLDDLGLDRIYLVGASMGGTAALLLAQREEVAGVVSISSPSTFQQVDALEHITDITAPKLFITSEDDLNAARSQEQFWVNAPEPKEQHVYPGSAHGTDLFASEHAADFEQRLMDFLAQP